MSSIDLIPADYRDLLRKMRVLRIFILLFVVLVLSASGVFTYYLYHKQRLLDDIAVLEKKKIITGQQRDIMERLQQDKERFKKQLALLNGLRTGASVQKIFEAIDRSLLDDEVWFKRWQFQRAGGPVQQNSNKVHAGYIIVLPADEKVTQPQAWQIETHMTIQGQARDHSALSRFVRRLYEQPQITDVRVIRTTLRRYTRSSVVDFDIAVVVNSRPEGV